MSEYKLYTINYMVDLNYKTNSFDEMQNRVKEIKELVKNNTGNSKSFFEGAFITIYKDGKEVNSVDYYNFDRGCK